MSPRQAKEAEFELPAYRLAAREWGVPGGLPVLALHGWLDNAGSFDLLAPRLTGTHLVALDAAGHGYSGSRSPDAGYELWSDVADVLAVADRLGWPRFTLLGHSRGAAVAALVAGSFPERVAKLVLLEGGVPFFSTPDQAPQTLAQSIRDTERYRGSDGGRVFDTRERAIEERAQGFTAVTTAAAEILAERSLRRVEGGYQWRVDQRLKAASALRYTREQAAAFVAATTAPVLVVLAEVSPFARRPEYRALLGSFSDVRILEIAGGHHCHLEGAEREIAAEVSRFLGLGDSE